MHSTRQLQGLPPKQALLLLLAEKARRQQLKLVGMPSKEPTAPQIGEHSSLLETPGHPLNDLKKPARYKILYGGRGGLKSWGIAEAYIKLAAHGSYRFLCTREYQSSIKESVHKLLELTIIRLGLRSWFDITNTEIRSRTGSEFIFKGLQDLDSLKSTESIDYCWIEEAHKTTKNSMEKLDPTIRKPNSEIWMSLNPDEETDHIYSEFIVKRKPGSIVHHINFDQNPYFPVVLENLRQIYLQAIADASNDEERAQAQSDYDHIWLGMCRRINNEIIFSGKYVIEEFPDDLYKQAPRLHFGADWGFAQDPTVLLRKFILNNNLYIEYEASGVGIEFTGNELDGKGELEQLFDSVPQSRFWPIYADNSRPETISFMSGLGFNIKPADKWPGSVEDGVAHIRGFKKIIIHPRCKRTQMEARQYRYKVDRMTKEVLPIIIDKNNHCWDASRYGLNGYIQKRGNLAKWEKLGREG